MGRNLTGLCWCDTNACKHSQIEFSVKVLPVFTLFSLVRCLLSRLFSDYDISQGQHLTYFLFLTSTGGMDLLHGKACGCHGLTETRLISCHPAVTVLLKSMFHCLLAKEFLPSPMLDHKSYNCMHVTLHLST